MLQRHLLVEAGIHLQLAGEDGHGHGDQRENGQYQRTVSENDAFGEFIEFTHDCSLTERWC